MNKKYIEFSAVVEAQLNKIFEVPARGILYGTVVAEVLRAKVSTTLPQITLTFKLPGTRQEQTIRYTQGIETLFIFEDSEVEAAVRTWQQELEKAFKGSIEISVVPAVCEVPEEPEVPEPEVQDEPKVEEPVEDTVEITEEATIEEAVIEEPQDVSPAEFIAWAVENLRTMTEDKATFKKDIPEEFIMWAATKRTITDGELLRMLADACPVTEE
jgi:hypothetical protein